MDRSRAIFEWVFGLPPEPDLGGPGGAGNASAPARTPYSIDFLSVADQVMRARRNRAGQAA